MYTFNPILKSVIWGGDSLGPLKCLKEYPANTGESWELSAVPGNVSVVAEGREAGTTLDALIRKHGASLVGEKVWKQYGERFPLLVKFIDARADLSVQVHPDDALAAARHNSPGKTEMWYVLRTTPGAQIHAGMSKHITPAQYTSLVEQKRIMEAVASHEAHPGDVFFLPAGRIHAIGAGCLLAEIQQTSDITYRVYDYDRRDADGNPRQLHTDLAREALDYDVYPEYRTDYQRDAKDALLVECPYFTVRKVEVDGETEITVADGSFTILICIDGECFVDDGIAPGTLRSYHTGLIGADARSIVCRGKATLLTASL